MLQSDDLCTKNKYNEMEKLQYRILYTTQKKIERKERNNNAVSQKWNLPYLLNPPLTGTPAQ